MSRLLAACSILSLVLSGCQPVVRAVSSDESRLVFVPESFVTEDDEIIEGERATLIVPEDYGQPHGRLIKLAVARFKSNNPDLQHPIIYLAGGPGGAGIYPERFPLLQALRDYGDVITFDQRGTGASEPLLDCPDSVSLPDAQLATREAMLEVYRDQALRCAAHWRGVNVDLANFNTRTSAADVDMLRRALGVDQIRLVSFSYGSHLALTVIKAYEPHIDRAVLAGIEGLDQTIKLPANVEHHLTKVSKLLSEDESAGTVLPDFAELVTELIVRLEEKPEPIQVKTESGESSTIKLTSFDLQRVVAGMIGRRFSIEAIPLVFGPAKQNDFSRFAMFYPALRTASVSAMQAAMDCSSGVSADRRQEIKHQGESSILGATIDFPYPEICEDWGVAQLSDDFRASFESAVPTLFLSGDLDGRTPVSNGAEISKHFSNSAHIIVTRMGHEGPGMFLRSPEVMEVIGEFMAGDIPERTEVETPPLEFRLPLVLLNPR